MTFIELREELLRVESLLPAASEGEPVHLHPKQESGDEVLSGSFVFEVEGEQRRLAAAETIQVPANAPHRFCKDGNEDARSIQQGKLDAKGMPPPLQLAAMVPEFSDEVRPVSPPWPLLGALSVALGPIARLRGYRPRVSA